MTEGVKNIQTDRQEDKQTDLQKQTGIITLRNTRRPRCKQTHACTRLHVCSHIQTGKHTHSFTDIHTRATCVY